MPGIRWGAAGELSRGRFLGEPGALRYTGAVVEGKLQNQLREISG